MAITWRGLNALGVTLRDSDLRGAFETARTAHALAARLGDRGSQVFSLWNATHDAVETGDWDWAEGEHKAGMESAPGELERAELTIESSHDRLPARGGLRGGGTLAGAGVRWPRTRGHGARSFSRRASGSRSGRADSPTPTMRRWRMGRFTRTRRARSAREMQPSAPSGSATMSGRSLRWRPWTPPWHHRPGRHHALPDDPGRVGGARGSYGRCAVSLPGGTRRMARPRFALARGAHGDHEMATLLEPADPEVRAAAGAAREILGRLRAAPFIARLDAALARSSDSGRSVRRAPGSVGHGLVTTR